MNSTYVIEIHTRQQREAQDYGSIDEAREAAAKIAKRFHCEEVIPLAGCDCLRPDNIMLFAKSSTTTIMIVRYYQYE